MEKTKKSLTRPSRLRTLINNIKTRRGDDLGREQGQTFVRVVIALCVMTYMIVGRHADFGGAMPSWFLIGMGFVALSIIVMVAALRAKSFSTWRHTAMNVGDISAVTYTMIATGETGIPLFVLYLWITLGNGFRFGTRAMAISAVLAIAGFSFVLALSPAWHTLTPVAVAIIAALILLPTYSAHLFSRDPKFLARTKQASKQAQQADDNKPSAFAILYARIQTVFEHIKLRRHDELGREQGQAIVRIAISSSVLAYLLLSHDAKDFADGLPLWFTFLSSFIVLSAVVMVFAMRDAKSSIARRTITNLADVVAISYLMTSTNEAGIPLFVLYLWITLGNGFRFGVPAMAVSSVLSLTGFTTVVMASSVWQDLPTLTIGVYCGLVLIPSYTAHLISQLHRSRKHAEEANMAKGRFLARMSHELRTPLNGILGATELLGANKRLTAEDHALIGVIRDSVRVSLRQIDNVLDFAKMEAGKLVIEQTEFDLHDLLNRTVRLVRGIAHDKNLRLMLRVDPKLPFRLVGDPHYVQEVLLNLLSNAIKFTEQGYVSLDAEFVRGDDQSAVIRLAVHDTGIGIEPQALDRIFEAFSQEDISTTRRYGGTGLGTTIAKQLVDLMGGRLDVSSKKDLGSIFSAEIPFIRQPEDGAEDGSLAGMRILIVTDRPALRDRLAALSQDWGVSVNVGATISEAIGLLKRGIRVGNPIDAVLVDSGAVLAENGAHLGGDFLNKAWLSFTPAFLICDVSPGEAQLRKWGYAGAVSYDSPRATIFSALHASGLHNAETDQGVVRVEPWAWGSSPAAPRQRPKLLVADDNRTNLMILRKILETANFDVDTAEDGEQALEMMLRTRYKAAILDMHMPGLDGTTVIKQYRLLQSGARLPIIMLTANATVDAKVESAEAGADAYLTKPASASAIISTIEKLLDNTEVVDLSRRRPNPRPAQDESTPVLDTTIISELDRLYNDPSGIAQILDEFERESQRLLDNLSAAVTKKNHAGFCDVLHALKGNGANVGAMRLSQACHEVGMCGLIDFRRDGAQMLDRIHNEFNEALKALREFTALGGSPAGPAQGSDLPD